ncbi:PKDCC [Mytilus coruscus]|uniref:PKDCC n=1 Tax=Mytilus coruscus TaxID=42192 RepID=A0A6J8CZK1_MYTCO|nr:PKDCC [Mytilus coruscus]
MRLLRYRYKSAWIAFLILFSIAGVMLTYKRLSDSRSDGSKKNDLNDLVEGGDMNFAPVNHGMDKPRYPEVDIMEVQALQHNIERQKDKLQALPKIELPALDSNKYRRIKSLLKNLYPLDWGRAQDADDMIMEVSQELYDLGFESPMSCKDIDGLRISSSFRVGKKKFIDRAFVPDKGVEVIMKSQANDLDIKVKCLQSVYDADKCSMMGNYGLLREVLWFSVLKHDGIADLLGYCIRGDQIDHLVHKKGVILLTEPGIPVMPSTFSIIKFHDRLKYAVQLSELLHFLEYHPLGSLALTNTYNSDFVIVNNKLKLVDLDDVAMEEKACRFNADCKIPGASQVKVTCNEAGRCVNRNAKLNLKKMGPLMFEQMLNNAHPGYTSEVNKLRHGIISLTITNDEVLQTLRDIEKRYVPEKEEQQQIEERQRVQEYVVQNRDQQKDSDRQQEIRQQEIQQNRIIQDQQKPLEMKDGDYEKVTQSNFPGKYDFPCPLSRVAWGCVVTVRSLKEAKQTCNSEPKCQAFVLFTSQPDAEVLMTMVLKNSRLGSPEKNVGATLFLYTPRDEMGQSNQNLQVSLPNKAVEQRAERNVANGESSDLKPAPADFPECKARIDDSAKDARKSRERRLMAHLGLKSYTEADWIQKMKWQKIVSHEGLNDFTSPSTVGGRFNVTMIGADKDSKLKNALYLAEIGPSQFHIAHYIVYKLDRLLGIYHTPPSIVWYMTRNEVDIVRGDDTWKNRLDLVAPHTEIKGVLTCPIPAVLKQENLLINEQRSVVQEIKEFTRQEKMQVEYVLLWYLAKIYHVKETPYAYKGHMIQFGADCGFQDLSVELLPYLYNCQFPNIVYKMMSCFKCHYPGKSKWSICGLGEEVMKQVEEDGFNLSDFKIHQMTPKILSQVINEAAAEVLDAVDQCIRSHSREKVLY